MKNLIKYSSLALLSFTLFMSSCKKTEDTPSTPTPAAKTGIVTCKINGTAWESDVRTQNTFFIDTIVPSVRATLEGDTLSLLAFRTRTGDSSALLMNVLLSPSGIGTYTMSSSDYNIYYLPSTNLQALFTTLFTYTASSSMTITKFDKANRKISGTFNTTMTPSASGATYTVTDGAFTDLYLD
jgi:hypothetical protein